jgi:hypothetical protein
MSISYFLTLLRLSVDLLYNGLLFFLISIEEGVLLNQQLLGQESFFIQRLGRVSQEQIESTFVSVWEGGKEIN